MVFHSEVEFFKTSYIEETTIVGCDSLECCLQSAFFYCPYAVLPFIHQDTAIKPKKDPVISLELRSFNFLPLHRRKVNSVHEACAKCFAVHILKGVFSKPKNKKSGQQSGLENTPLKSCKLHEKTKQLV